MRTCLVILIAASLTRGRSGDAGSDHDLECPVSDASLEETLYQAAEDIEKINSTVLLDGAVAVDKDARQVNVTLFPRMVAIMSFKDDAVSIRLHQDFDIEGETPRFKLSGFMPQMFIGSLIAYGMFPFILMNVKVFVMKAMMINNMILGQVIIRTLRDLVFGPKPGGTIIYKNYGYKNKHRPMGPPHRYRIRPAQHMRPPAPPLYSAVGPETGGGIQSLNEPWTGGNLHTFDDSQITGVAHTPNEQWIHGSLQSATGPLVIAGVHSPSEPSINTDTHPSKGHWLAGNTHSAKEPWSSGNIHVANDLWVTESIEGILGKTPLDFGGLHNNFQFETSSPYGENDFKFNPWQYYESAQESNIVPAVTKDKRPVQEISTGDPPWRRPNEDSFIPITPSYRSSTNTASSIRLNTSRIQNNPKQQENIDDRTDYLSGIR